MSQVARIVSTVITFYGWVMVVYILMSWIPMKAGGFVYDVYRGLGDLVEPYLGVFRRLIPPIGIVDVSPLVAFFVLQVLNSVIYRLLSSL